MASKSEHKTVQIVRFDWAIKALLRDKANFDVLEGFLQSLLDEKLTIEEILESESNTDSPKGRYNRVDLIAKDSEGRRILIEIQNERESDYIERMLFGTSKTVVESMKKGDRYSNIPKIISIHILYFNLGTGNDYVYSGTTELLGVHTDEPLKVSEQFTDDAGATRYRPRNIFPEYHVINVERFNKMDEEDLEMLDQWIYLFKQSEVRGDFNAPGISTAREKLAYLKMDEKQRARHDRFVMDYVRELDIMDTAHQDGRKIGFGEGREKGIKEGHEKGIKEGHEKGIKEGHEKGIKEGKIQERIAMAMGFRESGFSDQQIANGMKITIDELQRLLADNKDA